MAKGELSDDEVMTPPHQGELSDADVSQPAGVDFLHPGAALQQYARQGLEEFKQATGFTLGGFKFIGAGLASIPAGIVDTLTDAMTLQHKGWNEGLTPDEEADYGTKAAFLTIGRTDPFIRPKTPLPSATQEFHEQVA